MKNYKLIKFDKNEAFISGPDDKVFYELKQVVDELNKKDKENNKMKKFIDRFLDTEDLGYTFGKAMRDDAREALGMKRVET